MARTQLLPEVGKLVEVRLVLRLVLDLLLYAFKDANGGGVVVEPAGGLEGGLDNRGAGDKIVREAVVQAALQLERVLDALKELSAGRQKAVLTGEQAGQRRSAGRVGDWGKRVPLSGHWCH